MLDRAQPLNGMMGMLQLIKHCDTLEEAMVYVDKALECGKHLDDLLEDTLDVKRFEQGRITLNSKPL